MTHHSPLSDSPLAFVAIQAALNAGQIIRSGYGTSFTPETKSSPYDFVTPYDRAAETAIINLIKDHFPDHIFLAEESCESYNPAEIAKSPVCWIIDPLDGTMNFVHHIPLFAVSIAAMMKNQIEIAVIYQPITNELFVAQRGRGAYLNGRRLHVSNTSQLNRAIGSTGFPFDLFDVRNKAINQFNEFLSIGIPIRLLGSATINLAYVAAGRFDFCWTVDLKSWDIAAGQLIVEEAGGTVTHFDGSPHSPLCHKSTLATNGILHAQVLNYFK